MRAEFFKPDEAARIVGTADWDGAGLHIEAKDDEARLALSRVFRPTPVTVDDPSLRASGTSGPVVLPPGSLSWFLAAARIRAPAEGLSVRIRPGGKASMGWDPAGAYRTFGEALERREGSNRESPLHFSQAF